MLQLKNPTPLKAGIGLFPDAHGVDTLYVAVRATFVFAGGTLALAEKQEPLKLADEYWGEPGTSSVKHAADLHLGKLTTDVAMIGEAVSPGEKFVPELDVSLSVGPVSKIVRIYGDREWSGLLGRSLSSPVPFQRMPLLYERAFGGVTSYDEKKDEMVLDRRNPVGVGFGLRKAPEDKAQKKLPNLEDPAQLISGPGDKPKPAGFGYLAPGWEPRIHYAGTYDEAWQEKRAPYLPKDFDARFFNAAHPDLVCPEYLQGGEPVRVSNASPELFECKLPRVELKVEVDVASSTERPKMNLQTVLIEPEPRRIGLVWLGAVPCDKKTLLVKEARIDLGKLA